MASNYNYGIMEDSNYTNVNHTDYDDYNGTIYDGDYIDYKLFQKYKYNMAVPETAYYCLIAAYVVLIVIGSTGNLLVLAIIVSNKSKSEIFYALVATFFRGTFSAPTDIFFFLTILMSKLQTFEAPCCKVQFPSVSFMF